MSRPELHPALIALPGDPVDTRDAVEALLHRAGGDAAVAAADARQRSAQAGSQRARDFWREAESNIGGQGHPEIDLHPALSAGDREPERLVSRAERVSTLQAELAQVRAEYSASQRRERALRRELSDATADYEDLFHVAFMVLSREDFAALLCLECEDKPVAQGSRWCREHAHLSTLDGEDF